jgi:hypothetical protein
MRGTNPFFTLATKISSFFSDAVSNRHGVKACYGGVGVGEGATKSCRVPSFFTSSAANKFPSLSRTSKWDVPEYVRPLEDSV